MSIQRHQRQTGDPHGSSAATSSEETVTFKSLGEIVAPLTKGLSQQYAEKLEEEADRLETEADLKRYCARLIRTGVV